MTRRRKQKKEVVTHFDEQAEGALMESVKTLKPYAKQGIVIVQTDEGVWKILAFGNESKTDSFEGILFECINAGAISFLQGDKNITNWDI